MSRRATLSAAFCLVLAVVCASMALAAPPVTGEAGAAPLRFEDAGEARRFQRLVEAGLVNDATFAQTRSLRLSRAGRSSRAIAAHLAWGERLGAWGTAGGALVITGVLVATRRREAPQPPHEGPAPAR